MTKQQKLEIREKLILKNARGIVKTDGIFEFKMSSIAKSSNISIGTLYIHFSSKEDVLVALACESITEVKEYFKNINSLDLTYKQKLLAFTFVSHVRRDNDNYVSELEQLVTNSSVRKRASRFRTSEHESLVQDTLEVVKSTIKAATKEDSLSNEKHEDICNSLLYGLWSLSLGSLSILELNIFYREGLNIKNPLVQNAAHLVNSYIIKNKIDNDEIKKIIEKIDTLIKKDKRV